MKFLRDLTRVIFGER